MAFRFSRKVKLEIWRLNNTSCLHHRPRSTSHNVAQVVVNQHHRITPEQPASYQTQNDRLDFSNFKQAFVSKTSGEILRALLVFRACSFDMLVENNKQLMSLSRKILGKRLFHLLMKGTFYGHFVAGEEQESIKSRLALMEKFGVGAILDYAVEADVPVSVDAIEPVGPCKQSEIDENLNFNAADIYQQYKYHRRFSDRRDHLYSARTYIYEDEKKCDENANVFMECIDTTGNTSTSGFAAIKITALGRPLLLLRLSEMLNQTQFYFDKMASDSQLSLERTIARDAFYHGLQDLGVDMTRQETDDLFNIIDLDRTGEIDIIEWHNFLTPQLKLAKLFKAKPTVTGERGEPLLNSLTDNELQEMLNMRSRLSRIAQFAEERGVRLMVDAEQTYFQPAISRLTLDAQRQFNRKKPIIFNTYQCYLKNTPYNIAVDIELSRREGFYFGCKLVRGAYMEQERVRAATVGYEDPVHATLEDTHQCYNKVLGHVLHEVKDRDANVMVASHNKETVNITVAKMKELGLNASSGSVSFGQLLGMCDGVTFALGQAGYSAYKYVPYGPVDEVLPYLSRRAMENRGMLQGVGEERKMLFNELTRRVKTGTIYHDPEKQVLA